MMNYPETPSAKTGSPFLVSPPFAFLKPPFPMILSSGIFAHRPPPCSSIHRRVFNHFLDIRQ